MSKRAHGQVRRSQIITTYGPGALIDLPNHSAIVGGLDTWGKLDDLDEVIEPRLTRKLQLLTGVPNPRLYSPPPDSNDPRETKKGIGVWRFPEWFVVREKDGGSKKTRSRRLVSRKALDDKGRFDGLQVVPTRFVRACPRGHVDDLDWHGYAHRGASDCARGRQLWLDERGTGGDLADFVVRCECKNGIRRLSDAIDFATTPLGSCRGRRPWLGLHTEEDCGLPSRLLIRTASNAYFPQVVSVLSLPERGSAVQVVVRELWTQLQTVETPAELAFLKKQPQITEKLSPFSNDEVMSAIESLKGGAEVEPPVKEVELEAMLAAPEGYGDDVPMDPDFHARRLPEHVWRHSKVSDDVECVIQLHRLREVMGLVGFTRFEAVTPDIHGEYETDVERADLALEPTWFPAVENRGEGVFIQLRADAVDRWLKEAEVAGRLDLLGLGHTRWADARKSKRFFPGGPYVLLHTLAHVLLQSLAMRCGYPASSIRERIYTEGERYGILLYTGSPDAEGTLGGLVQQARYIEEHLTQALRMSGLCSNDPICAQHEPGMSLEERWLHGASCHGCTLIAETSCEMRNDYLDRALVVPILGVEKAAFFDGVP